MLPCGVKVIEPHFERFCVALAEGEGVYDLQPRGVRFCAEALLGCQHAARKDIASDEVCSPSIALEGMLVDGDGLDDGTAVVLEELCDFCEVLPPIVFADRLVHFDGDDGIVSSFGFSVVLDGDVCVISERTCLFSCPSRLLVREGDSAHAVSFGDGALDERAPSASYLHDGCVLADVGDDSVEFILLGLLQREAFVGKQSAGVGHRCIEPLSVEAVAEVVVGFDIAATAIEGVALEGVLGLRYPARQSCSAHIVSFEGRNIFCEKFETSRKIGRCPKIFDPSISNIGKNASVMEIGCGWGSFIQRAVSKGHRVRGITLSHEQARWAREKARPFGDDAHIAIQDYRKTEGRYDAIVSIEMYEAVGENYWWQYFAKIAQLLKNNGSAVIQAITIDEHSFESYRRGTDFIRSYVFPGGMLASKQRFRAEAHAAGLQVVDSFSFGKSYAKTLEMWLDNFNTAWQHIAKLGFDERFARIWQYYLAGCRAVFLAGTTDVSQIQLRHARS